MKHIIVAKSMGVGFALSAPTRMERTADPGLSAPISIDPVTSVPSSKLAFTPLPFPKYAVAKAPDGANRRSRGLDQSKLKLFKWLAVGSNPKPSKALTIGLDYWFIASKASIAPSSFKWPTISCRSCSVETPSLNHDFKHSDNSMVLLLILFRWSEMVCLDPENTRSGSADIGGMEWMSMAILDSKGSRER